jgi:peptidyl-prolyl cis-trans isomerase-like 4
VAFVCKLNRVTTDADLYMLFSRFGPVKSCEVMRDWKTGDSLQYGFVEYENPKDCDEAILKMNGVQVDERRIRVDYSQSVAKLWKKDREADLLSKRSLR